MHKQLKEKLLKQAENSIFSFFIKRRKIAYLIAIGIFLAGAVSSVMIVKENAPKIDFGIVNISTIYNGASAVDIDNLITDKIEKEIDDISDIKKISSTSKNSISNISVEFEPSADMSEKMNELRSGIDNVKKNLPDGAEDPEITKMNSALAPIFNLHLSGNVSNALLYDHADNLKDILEKNSLIEEVVIQGAGEREIYVDLDPLKIRQFNLSSSDVINALKSANKDYPVGNFDIQGFEYNLRIAGKFQNTEDIKKMVVKNLSSEKGNSFVLLSDIANVYEKFDDENGIEKLIVKNENGEFERLNTLLIYVKKADSKNIFEVDKVARTIIEDYAERNFNGEIRIDYFSEMIIDVKDSYGTVFENGIQSIIIVVLLMIIFVGVKEGLSTGIIIPLSFLATITALFAIGSSLSFMSNFSMILALGIIVDTAIVIVEGIHDGLKKGFTAQESAMLSVYEFRAPLFSGFLTTIAVFIPLIVLPGVMGKYLSFIPITVSIVLVFSLVISFFVIPAIAATILEGKEKCCENVLGGENKNFLQKIISLILKIIGFPFSVIHNFLMKLNKIIEKKFIFYGRQYKIILKEKLPKKFFRRVIFTGVVGAFIIAMMLPVQFTMFPSDDVNYFSVLIKDEPGSSTFKTQEVSRKIEHEIAKIPEVKYIETSISDNKSSINIELFDKDERKLKGQRTSIEIINFLQKDFKKYKNQIVQISEQKKGPGGGDPVGFRIIVGNADQIGEVQYLIDDVKNILKKISGTTGVTDDLSNTPGEVKFVINRGKALALGLNPDLVGTVLRSAVEEIEATEIQSGGDDVSVNVRYDRSKILNFDDLANIQILNNQGKGISLSQVVTQNLQSNLMNIKRVDGNVTITVSSLLTKDGNALEITKKALEEIGKIDLPYGVSIETAGENSENADLFTAMLIGFIAAIFIIFTILVIQFDSYTQPLMILFTIIMAQTGVSLGLFLTDTMRSMAFLIGSISLAGIVVNDAIIMIDKINNLAKENPGEKLSEIIAEAGESRLQPIVLTTLTTTAGILPLMWVDSFWAGLSVTIVFGLLVASSLTLLVIPVMVYSIKNKEHQANIDTKNILKENL